MRWKITLFQKRLPSGYKSYATALKWRLAQSLRNMRVIFSCSLGSAAHSREYKETWGKQTSFFKCVCSREWSFDHESEIAASPQFWGPPMPCLLNS